MPPEVEDQLSTKDHAQGVTMGERAVAVLCLAGSGAGPPEGARVVRLGGAFEIGRGDPALSSERWRLADDTVSRRHARIVAEGGRWTLADLGSHNGTLVDRALVKGAGAPLGDGAVVVVGAQVAVFRLVSQDQLAALEAEQDRPLGPLGTASPALALTVRRLRALADCDRPLLISGETGTGKEVYARAVHALSGRRGPFLAVNCAAFQRELLESELFGYRRGSHSQATEDSPGIVAAAEGGTLLLDEIGEMPPELQAKLLRFLQDKTFFGVGWLRPRRADVRILGATQSPQDSLRPDVLGRFGAEPFLLPPLRRRIEDVGVLAHHFLAAAAGARAGVPARFERRAFLALCHHAWARNVRELEAAVGDAALVAAQRGDEAITLRDLPEHVRQSRLGDTGSDDGAPDPEGSAPTPAGLRTPAKSPGTNARRKPRPPPTRAELERLLRDHRGDIPALARALDRHREQVWRWCKSFGLDPREFRNE
jgi:transcriptional regulator with PAS, ATPase and Fis domain